MRGCARFILFSALALLVTNAVSAQERGHVAGVFGWTFGEQTDTLYGAQFGIGLNDSLQIIGGIENLQDVLTGRFALLLEDIARIPGADVQGKIPATYGGAGLRFTFHGLAASPFLQGEFGATRIDPTGLIVLANGEDVTDRIFDLKESTELTFVLGAGLRFDVGEHFLAEATFKFFDILAEEEDMRLNRLSFAAGIRF